MKNCRCAHHRQRASTRASEAGKSGIAKEEKKITHSDDDREGDHEEETLTRERTWNFERLGKGFLCSVLVM